MKPMSINQFKCSQTFAFVASITLAIMGIISLAVSIWMLTSNNWSVIFSYQINLMCTFMIVAGCLMILGGIYGAWAAYRSSNVHLSGFYGVLILSALLLMVCGVLAIALPLRVIVAGCGAPAYPVIAGLNATATQAIGTICMSCQCFYNISLSGVNMSLYNTNNTNSALPTRAPKCENWTKTAYDDLLENLESSFSCAGWCPGTKGNIYLMTNVNNGVPSSACYQATTNWFRTFSRTIGICAFVFGGIIVVLIGAVWWHLCELVDGETERILFLTGKLPPMQQPPVLRRVDSIELTHMQLPGVQQVSQISQPGSPGRQFGGYQPYVGSMTLGTEGNVMPQYLLQQQQQSAGVGGYVVQSRTYGSPR